MYFNNLDQENKGIQGRDGNRLRELQGRIEFLIRNSEDVEFTEYLRQRQAFLAGQERQLEQLAAELDSRVLMYERRMQERRMRQLEPAPVSRPVPQPTPQPVSMPQPQPTPQPVSMPQQPTPQPEPAPQQPQQQPTPQPVSLPPRQEPTPQPQPRIPAPKKRSAEFAIGVAVLSVVGAVFVLTGMVWFGIYFMDGLAKGLLFYAASTVVMLLSEIILYRRWPRLGMTISAIGMGGLYISTLINYLALRNFNQWVAMALTLIITLIVVLLSRKRDAAAYRILGMIATYVCILLVPQSEVFESGLSLTEFVTAAAMALIVNVMCLVVPVKKSRTGIHVTHMALNTAFTFIAIVRWTIGTDGRFDTPDAMWQRPIFLAASILVMQLIFAAQLRWKERRTPDASMADNMGICIAYGVSIPIYFLMAFAVTDFGHARAAVELFGDEHLFDRLVCSAFVAALCMIFLLILRKRQEKWFVWYLLNLLVLAIHVGRGEDWECYLFLLALLVAAKICSFTKRILPAWGDVVITTFVCMTVVFDREYVYVVPLAAGVLLSVFCLNYMHAYFETLLTFTIAIYTSSHMLSALKLPIFVGILFVGMLVFNNVGRWRQKGVVVFNILVLCGQAMAYLWLANPVYRNSYLTYLCMVIFGAATIVVCFQKRYHLELKCKPLILAIFLTYMGLVVRTNYPIFNSIALMLIALVCVGTGFAIQKMSVRIYGLVLSLLICAKLVLYDFMGANVLQKTILFSAVGVLALLIAAIYMVLERTREKNDSAKADARHADVEKIDVRSSER